MNKDITIKEYLNQKGVNYTERGNELITKCLFNDCDKDSQPNELHLYFNKETGQYECKKCLEKGNLITLFKHFNDDLDKPVFSQNKSTQNRKFNPGLVERCHLALPDNIREYLNKRGIDNFTINNFKLGYGTFYSKNWITIPIKDELGDYAFFKLRQDPKDGSDKMTYPNGKAQIYDWDSLQKDDDLIVICEGELDRLVLLSKGVPAITSTHGAGTFKSEWIEKLRKFKKIYVCFDNDVAGKSGAQRVIEMTEILTKTEVYQINLPADLGDKGDITDYFIKYTNGIDDLFDKYASIVKEGINTDKFKPLNVKDLAETLNLTIKYDQTNKIITFLCLLSAYTEDSQFNISFNAPSSTGKSYIPMEIAKLFPKEDVRELAYCSPTAFFHESGEYDKETNCITVDFSRKIITFLDQPHNDLLSKLRPFLSHDKKVIELKITDKSQKGGLKVKNIKLIGYPSVIFCTTGLKIDEQEASRFFLLSPEINQDKIREGISQTIIKETNKDEFRKWLDNDPERKLLKERILAIRSEYIVDIKIEDDGTIKKRFFDKNKVLKPRHQRDIKKLISLIKAHALLNLWWRKKEGSMIIANSEDIDVAFDVWEKVSVVQELNLPPYIYDFYNDVILKLWQELNGDISYQEAVDGALGLSRQELCRKHLDVYGRNIDNNNLRLQVLPALESAGLIVQEHNDPKDKRKSLIYPTANYTIVSNQTESADNAIIIEEITDQNYSGDDPGVNNAVDNQSNVIQDTLAYFN
ncbi:MAG: toprim domain-containing protein [Patescibacteria group bacterium]